MRRLITPLSLAALALALFGAWMHCAVLAPGNVGWLLDGQDRGQSAIGLAAYLRGGAWPSSHDPLLVAPEGTSLLFTDSIPLLGVLLGPLASVLPPGLQFVGPWLLTCVALQVGFAWLLVRPHAADRGTVLIGTALLAALPVLFNRYGHASLCAQWLILWALWVFVDARRVGRAGWWTAVLAVAALVHSYLLLMVAAIWASAVLSLAADSRMRRRAAIVALVPLVPVAAILAWHGAFAGGYRSTGTYGGFPLPLDALWNTGNPGYGALLPASPDDRGRGYEGFGYLGAGMLALVLVAVGMAIAGRRSPVPTWPARLGWLIPAFAVLLLVAIGPAPMWRGQTLGMVPLPQRMTNLLDPVRAAGRLAWPAIYTLAYAAIVAALRQRRATLLLGAALALQLVDLSPMLAAIRATTAAADDRRTYRRTLSPRWPALVAAASAVEFEPPDPFRDLQAMEEVSWRAVLACRPVRYFYTARERATTRARVEADRAAFRTGRIEPTRLYVLLDGRVPPALASRVQHLDGLTIIAPALPAPPPRCLSASSSPRSAS